MAINTEKNLYTVVFAAIMVVVVGATLAFVASSMSGKIGENQRFEKQQNILYAMGVNANSDEGSVDFIPANEVAEQFKKYIKEQYVIEGDKLTQDTTAYLVNVKQQQDLVKEGRPGKLPLFIGEKEGKKYYILPMYGKGLWDAIWGYIALDDQMKVEGVYFDHKGETAGLGANLKERYFMDDFTGETIMNGSEFEGISVYKGNNDPLNEDKEDNRVDALAGATITGNGITNMIHATVKFYQPYLETIKAKN